MIACERDDVLELRDLWLSRLMFNPFVGWPPETRSFDEFLRDHAAVDAPPEPTT